MTDYTQTYTYTKVDNVDFVEAQDFDDIEAEFTLIETASATKADKTGDTVSFASLTATTSVTFNGATVADLGTVTTIDLNGGTISGVTIDGGLTWSAAQDLNNQALTNIDIDSGAIDGTTVGATSASTGAFTTLAASTSVTFAGATVSNLGSVTTADINGGTISGVTVDGGLTWSAAQNLNSQNLTNVDINSGTVDGTTVGAASPSTGVFTALTASTSVTFAGATVANLGTVTTADINGGTIDGVAIGGASISTGSFSSLDWVRTPWTRIASAQSPYDASSGERIFCDCDGAIIINIPADSATNDRIWVRVDKDCDSTNSVTLVPGTGDSIGGQAANDTIVIDIAYANLDLVANASDNWDF